MTGRRAFVRELAVCLCIALPVALAAAPAARSQDDRTAFQERFNRGVSAAKSARERLDEQSREWNAGSGDGSDSWGDEGGTRERTAAPSTGREADWEQEAGSGDWPAADAGTSWDDDEWGREPDGGTGWDDGEWDRASDGGTGWDGESTHAAGSIRDYDDLMAELLREEDERRSEEEEARRILAIDAKHRRREAERLGLEQEQERQQAEDGEAGQLRQEARLLSEERERLEQEKESLREEREYRARLAAERQNVRMAEEQARQAREAREQRKKTLENLANTIVTGVVNIQAAKSGIDPSSNSVTHETWNAAKRGVQILNQTMGTGRSPHCVVKAPPGTGLSDIKLC